MKIKTNASRFSALFVALLLGSGSVYAAAIIYEPFADNDSTLTGNTPGTGLVGTWSANENSWNVSNDNTSLTYGSLATSGNRATNIGLGRGANFITTGTVGSNTLLNAGLLNNSQTLWFSFLWKMDDAAVSNGDAAFALGTGTLRGTNATPLAASGAAIGVSMATTNGTITAASWSGTVRAGGSPSAAWGDRTVPKLIVGKITWGVDASANDIIEIYTPGIDLLLPMAAVSSRSAVLDQSLFNTISFSTKSEGDPLIDEIRFGALYSDVVFASIPEPHVTLLGGLGLLALLRRRRA